MRAVCPACDLASFSARNGNDPAPLSHSVRHDLLLAILVGPRLRLAEDDLRYIVSQDPVRPYSAALMIVVTLAASRPQDVAEGVGFEQHIILLKGDEK